MKDKFWKGWILALTAFVILYGMAMESRSIAMHDEIDGILIAFRKVDHNFRRVDYSFWRQKVILDYEIYPCDRKDHYLHKSVVDCWIATHPASRRLMEIKPIPY